MIEYLDSLIESVMDKYYNIFITLGILLATTVFIYYVISVIKNRCTE